MLTALAALFMIILAVAVVALFAMMGELVTRVDSISAHNISSQRGVEDWATVLEEFTAKSAPTSWPSELQSVRNLPSKLVIVVSTSCRSCAHFLDGNLDILDGLSPALVVSCPSKDRADSFLKKHPVGNNGWPVYRDVMGQWSRDELGIDVSPSAVLFRDGEPLTAFTMTSAQSLAEAAAEKLAASAEEVR